MNFATASDFTPSPQLAAELFLRTEYSPSLPDTPPQQ